MADDKERQAVDQDLDVDEERSEEITGGADRLAAAENVSAVQAAAAAKRQPIDMPRAQL
jgi:hypothetical protein